MESRFWGRLGAALGQAWSRRGAKRGADPGQACFRRGQKGAQKRWNPRLESAIWGARLKLPGAQKQQPEIADSRGDLLQFCEGHKNEIPTQRVL